ncbi:MAG: phenylalanine-4-hydroxylase [Pyrinomonadaceae bacterium]|jgi:phenylalanine-4-hydroxylase|nr:phenylalanine-4-hydroxylase [Pyrinomonadaceae bacterium]
MLQEQQRQLSTTTLPDITTHGDAACPTRSNGRRALVELDPDHPGFRDRAYRARRDEIAEIALRYEPGAPVPDAPYTEEEHQLWRTVRDALAPRHQSHACAEYLTCVRQIDLARERIPQLREVSEKVRAFSGFRLEPVGGLVAPRVFLESLANGVFLSTQYIRHHSTPLYTPEPDVVHELLGHAVLLASDRIAELNRLVGEAVRRTTTDEALERLARVYWFTIEFGVVREAGAVKAYGAGLVSSAGELEAMRRAELRPLDLEAAARQEFDTTDYQPVLFCADSFESMFESLRDYLLRWP